jgi:hypothetical protein
MPTQSSTIALIAGEAIDVSDRISAAALLRKVSARRSAVKATYRRLRDRLAEAPRVSRATLCPTPGASEPEGGGLGCCSTIGPDRARTFLQVQRAEKSAAEGGASATAPELQ